MLEEEKFFSTKYVKHPDDYSLCYDYDAALKGLEYITSNMIGEERYASLQHFIDKKAEVIPLFIANKWHTTDVFGLAPFNVKNKVSCYGIAYFWQQDVTISEINNFFAKLSNGESFFRKSLLITANQIKIEDIYFQHNKK